MFRFVSNHSEQAKNAKSNGCMHFDASETVHTGQRLEFTKFPRHRDGMTKSFHACASSLMPVNDINRPCSIHGREHLTACQDVE